MKGNSTNNCGVFKVRSSCYGRPFCLLDPGAKMSTVAMSLAVREVDLRICSYEKGGDLDL